jgi:RimJ/RimL family protein N-acetyltransferase
MNVDASAAISDEAAPSPVLETDRLVLRPLRTADADAFYRLADHPDVAATTTFVYPYSLALATEMIERHREEDARGAGAHFAVVSRETGEPCGEIGLTLEPAHGRAELGYWLGRAYWGRGFCTEAGKRILEHGFGSLGLHRIYAFHFSGNDVSGRVPRSSACATKESSGGTCARRAPTSISKPTAYCERSGSVATVDTSGRAGRR